MLPVWNLYALEIGIPVGTRCSQSKVCTYTMRVPKVCDKWLKFTLNPGYRSLEGWYKILDIVLELKTNNMHTKRFLPLPYNRGAFGPDHPTIDHNSKMAHPSTSKFDDFSFLYVSHNLAEFEQIRLMRGGGGGGLRQMFYK